jgi:hypothetical protein
MEKVRVDNMKLTGLNGEDVKELDILMAQLISSPTTENVLDFARKVRVMELNQKKSTKEFGVLGKMYSDALSLHHAVLIFETDPELVAQNAMARVLSGITPALLSFEEYLSHEDMKFWEILIDGTAVVSHWVSTTPYVTGAKMQVDFRFQEELVKVEERLTELFLENGESAEESVKRASEFCDNLRKNDLGEVEKPGYIFFLWYAMVMVSYKNFKDLL